MNTNNYHFYYYTDDYSTILQKNINEYAEELAKRKHSNIILHFIKSTQINNYFFYRKYNKKENHLFPQQKNTKWSKQIPKFHINENFKGKINHQTKTSQKGRDKKSTSFQVAILIYVCR